MKYLQYPHLKEGWVLLKYYLKKKTWPTAVGTWPGWLVNSDQGWPVRSDYIWLPQGLYLAKAAKLEPSGPGQAPRRSIFYYYLFLKL